jgi:hypothetical protein
MSPEIALTLQTMGLELSNVRTELMLEQALERLGVTMLGSEDDSGEWSGSAPALEGDRT